MILYKTIFCLSVLLFLTFIEAEQNVGEDAQNEMFTKFKDKYGKQYATAEEHEHRFKVFKDNLRRAAELQKAQRGTAKYGVTKFSDLTAKEFKETYLGVKKPDFLETKRLPIAEIPNVKLPKNFDWRDNNAVTAVKNQGGCGSCWTFSVTGNVEGQYAIKNNELLSFSEQEIVDCDKLNSGCSGGWPPLALQSLDSMGGLELEDVYPYTGVDGECAFKKSESKVKIIGSVSLPVNETAIAQWMYANGPVSICLNADDMQLYSSGISRPSSSACERYYLDHAVLITGFGVKKVNKKKLPFWIIKNSWGTDWGEEGYYRVYRGDGTCGIDLMVVSATIE